MTLRIKTILVPIDFSANSDRALDYAAELARRFDAAIHLLHVCEVPTAITGPMDAYAIADPGSSQQLADEAARELVRWEQRLASPKVSGEIRFGNPARSIVMAADANLADLIVMGTHGHGPIMHLVMGNVAERVVRTATCPVLTVREPLERVKEAERDVVAARHMPALCLIGALALAILLPAAAAA